MKQKNMRKIRVLSLFLVLLMALMLPMVGVVNVTASTKDANGLSDPSDVSSINITDLEDVFLDADQIVRLYATGKSGVPEIVLEFDKNGAIDGKMADIVADENGRVVVPEHEFVNDNYYFTGWNTSPDGAGFFYNPGDEIVLTESLKLYAQWLHKGANLVEFTITYDANGGKGETVDLFGPYLEGNYAYTAYCEFYKKGATFIEWNTAADGSGTAYAEDEMFEIYGNVTLYAIWDNYLGDLDDDGVKNAKDSLIILKASVGKITLTSHQKIVGEVSGDNAIDAKDALLILRYAVGRISKFPVEG